MLIRTLPGAVSSLSVLSATDVWYFGDHGVVHWNGKQDLEAADEVHGRRQRAVKRHERLGFHRRGDQPLQRQEVDRRPKLRPDGHHRHPWRSPPPASTRPAWRPYAAALLHYNGKRWSRTWESGDQETFPEQRIVRDGNGGLWILAADDTERTQMLHYTGGKMRVATPLLGRVL